MTLKTCYRCDWEGETANATCPRCGVPLYVVGAGATRSRAPDPSPRVNPKTQSGDGPTISSIVSHISSFESSSSQPRDGNQSVTPNDAVSSPLSEKSRPLKNQNKIGALAIAAISMAGVVLFLVNRAEDVKAPASAQTMGRATDERPTARELIRQARAEPEQVALGFVQAYGDFDAKKAMTYVADDANVRGVIESQVPASPKGLSLELSMLRAQGYEQSVTSCDRQTSGSVTTRVICQFDFDALKPDRTAGGPFTGSYFIFTVRDGKIVYGDLHTNIEQFSQQRWEPFAKWVSRTYPQDSDLMFRIGDSKNPIRLWEQSIQLWEQHTREYVKKVKRSRGDK